MRTPVGFLAEDREKIVGVVPLVCSKAGSKEGAKYEKGILLCLTLNVVGLFLCAGTTDLTDCTDYFKRNVSKKRKGLAVSRAASPCTNVMVCGYSGRFVSF